MNWMFWFERQPRHTFWFVLMWVLRYLTRWMQASVTRSNHEAHIYDCPNLLGNTSSIVVPWTTRVPQQDHDQAGGKKCAAAHNIDMPIWSRDRTSGVVGNIGSVHVAHWQLKQLLCVLMYEIPLTNSSTSLLTCSAFILTCNTYSFITTNRKYLRQCN